jgi:AcrR family transcriptional regulator
MPRSVATAPSLSDSLRSDNAAGAAGDVGGLVPATVGGVARTVDLILKQALLDEVVDYLAAHGLGVSSLRPMAMALGVSTHRLVHHFGSKAELLDSALRRATTLQENVRIGWLAEDPTLGQPELLRRWWAWLLEAPEHLALVRLGFEAVSLDATVTGLAGDVRERQIGVWRSSIEDRLVASGFPADSAGVEASLAKAVFTGLIMDLLASGEVDRLTGALEHYLCGMETRLESAALQAARNA